MKLSDAEWIYPLLMAVAKGGTLQFLDEGEWVDAKRDSYLSFANNKAQYRIKPVPKEVAVIEVLIDDGVWVAHSIISHDRLNFAPERLALAQRTFPNSKFRISPYIEKNV